MRINFDLDGTLADLYAVENWLGKLRSYNPTPYAEAEPLVRMSSLARILNRLQSMGYEICILTWLAGESTPEYDEAVTLAKIEWLRQHMPSVHFDDIICIPYGTPKENYCYSALDVLFDDSAENRNNWNGLAYDETNIINVLKGF